MALIGLAYVQQPSDNGRHGSHVSHDPSTTADPRLCPFLLVPTRYYSGKSGRATLSNGAKTGVSTLEQLARSLAQTVQHMEVCGPCLSRPYIALCANSVVGTRSRLVLANVLDDSKQQR